MAEANLCVAIGTALMANISIFSLIDVGLTDHSSW